MNCLYYNHVIQKKIPCAIIPGYLFTINDINNMVYMCGVSYDESSLNSYGLTMDQINKYCSENINIHNIYPAENQDDIDYFNDCIDNHIVDRAKELKRFEKIYSYISNLDEISIELLYRLCNLIITDLQFKFLTHEEKLFMRSLSEMIYVEKPAIIPVIEFVRMINNLFNRYNGNDVFDTHNIDNVNNLISYKYVFPLTLNVANIKQNVQFLTS